MGTYKHYAKRELKRRKNLQKVHPGVVPVGKMPGSSCLLALPLIPFLLVARALGFGKGKR